MHCDRCHKEYKSGERHIWLCGEVRYDCSICPSNKVKALQEKMYKDSKKRGREADIVYSIFGDTFTNTGFVEEYLITDKGRAMKFYGCTLPYRNVCDGKVVDSIANVKSTVIETVKIVLKYRFFTIILLPFWKSVLKDSVIWLTNIYFKDLEKKTYNRVGDFAPVTKELLVKGIKMAQSYFPMSKGDLIGEHADYVHLECRDGKNIKTLAYCYFVFQNKVIRFLWCLLSLIQFDNAYYYRVHDFLNELKVMDFILSPRRELMRVFDLCISREHQIQGKMKMMKKVVNYAMIFPPTKKVIISYVQSLNFQEFVPDDSDRYWYGRRRGYDFEGKSLEERVKFSEDLDKKLNHVIK